MRSQLITGLIGLTLLAAGCSSLPGPAQPAVVPALALSPASLGSDINLAQQLHLAGSRHTLLRRIVNGQTLDAQLEVDAQDVRLAAFAMGTRVFTMHWDGSTLNAEQGSLLLPRVDARRILRDIQLAYWPAAAVQAALPPSWTLEEQENRRTLKFEGREVVVLHYAGSPAWQGQTLLDNHLEGYRLRIESVVQEP